MKDRVRGAGSCLNVKNRIRCQKMTYMVRSGNRDAGAGCRRECRRDFHFIIMDRIDLITVIVWKSVGDMDDSGFWNQMLFSIGAGHFFISLGEMKPLVMNRHCTVRIVCIHEIGQNDLAGMSSAGDWCGGDIAHPEGQMMSPFLLSEGV